MKYCTTATTKMKMIEQDIICNAHLDDDNEKENNENHNIIIDKGQVNHNFFYLHFPPQQQLHHYTQEDPHFLDERNLFGYPYHHCQILDFHCQYKQNNY